MSANLYIILESRLGLNYSVAHDKLVKEAAPKKKIKIPPASVFIGHGCVQHAYKEWQREHCT